MPDILVLLLSFSDDAKTVLIPPTGDEKVKRALAMSLKQEEDEETPYTKGEMVRKAKPS